MPSTNALALGKVFLETDEANLRDYEIATYILEDEKDIGGTQPRTTRL